MLVLESTECTRCDAKCPAFNAVGLWHGFGHRQEAQLQELQSQRQGKMDDDFVHTYVKANRLDEYRSHLDYEPDLNYIVFSYRFGKEEWLSFIKKFKRQFLDLFFDCFKPDSYYVVCDEHHFLTEQFNSQTILYLLENGALSVHDAADFLNIRNR